MAAEFGTNIATKVAETCIDKAMKEAGYLCCFKSYVEDYEKEHSRLLATRESLQKDIKEARQRNETEIDDETQQWLKEANDLVNIDTKEKKKWFGFLTNCIWQYKRGKELAGKTLDIPKLMERRKNLRIARSIGAPGMEYHSSQEFIYFESRKAKFEQLKKALKNSNNHLVGLQGMGGTGKTTMATQVGKEFEESKLFDKVIFTVVSNPPNEEKIRSDIAKRLVSQPEDAKNLKDASSLWSRISNNGEKILIILDDVWQELNLKAIGIPLGFHQKGHCNVLLTTRSMTVCKKMDCQDTISLEVLSEEDALNLFLLHAGVSLDNSSNDIRNIASNIVKECGKLPVAIVPIAKTLKYESPKDWEATLIRLENFDPTDDIDEDLKEVYKSLRSTYDNLRSEKAKELFLLCSLFPEDYELPMEKFSRIAIGLGHCGNANKYYIARSRVREITHKLIDSSLLLKDDEDECVKMHDLIREVAQWIGKEEIQVIVDSKTILKENIRYSFWNIDGFPNHFDGKTLEFLQINAKDYSMKLPDELFKDMIRLRVLILMVVNYWVTPTLSLPLSFHSLRNIRTLILERWKLGDISIMGSLKSLETLELTYCWITKLPEEIEALEKLRLLGLKRCEIERDNPFKVIERIPKLEELYYVDNHSLYLDKINEGEEIHQIGTFHAWQRYQIIQSNRFFVDDSSVSRRFSPGKLIKIFSEATIKDLAARAEILDLGECQKTGRTNLIPDIVPMENGGIIRLQLYDWSEIECVIHTKNLQSSVPIISKLVNLELAYMDVKELCCGPLPTDFLKQLKTLRLYDCVKLESMLFKGKLDLGKLKHILLKNCSMSSLFHPSTARSLKQLERLIITECKQLKYIITNEGVEEERVDADNDNIFPSIKDIDISHVPNFINILECQPQSHHLMSSLHTCSQSQASKTELVLDRVQCLLRPPLNPHNMREMTITHCSNITSLFTFPIASSMLFLEELEVKKCHGLKHLITDEGDGHDHMDKSSIFPKLQKVSIQKCRLLESLFPASHCTTFDHLESVKISHAHELRYVFGKCYCKDKLTHHNVKIHLPTLNRLIIHDVPNMVNICGENIYMKASSLKGIDLIECPQLPAIPHLTDFILGLHEIQDDLAKRKLQMISITECEELVHIIEETEQDPDLSHQECFPNLTIIYVKKCKMLKCLFSISTCGVLPNLLELKIEDASELKQVFGYNQDEKKEMSTEDVFPNLETLVLQNLPSLDCICQGFDFKTVPELVVHHCPKISLTSTTTISDDEDEDGPWLDIKKEIIETSSEDEEGPEDQYNHVQSKSSEEAASQSKKEAIEGLIDEDLHNNNTSNFTESKKTTANEAFKQVPTSDVPAMSASSSNSIPQQKPSLEVHEKKPRGDREAVDESLSTKEPPGRVDRPANEVSSEEGSEKTMFEDTSPLISSVSSSKKPEAVTAPTETEPGGSKSNHGDISCNVESPRSKEREKLSAQEGLKLQKEIIADEIMDSEELSKPSPAPPFISLRNESPQRKKEATKEVVDEDMEIQEQNNNTSNLTESNKVAPNEAIQQVPSSNIPRMAASSSNSDMNTEESIGEGPSSEKYNKPSSSTTKELNETARGVEKPLDNTHDVEDPTKDQCSTEERSNITALAIPPTLEEMKDSISSISSSKKPQIVSPTTDPEPGVSQSNQADISGNSEFPQDKIIVNQIEVDNPKQFEEDDLIRLFKIMEEGADMEVHMPRVSNIASADDDNKASKAFSDVESLLKMDVNEIANSQENSLCLENDLKFLSTHYSRDGAPSLILKDKINSMLQEISSILSSFRQASSRLSVIDTFTELEEKEKCINEELPQRKEAAITLISEICETKKSMLESQKKEVELKEQITRLQTELNRKEKEIRESEIKLSSLEEQKKKSVWDTIGFLEECEAVKKKRSQIVEEKMKARQELEKVDIKWSSCGAEWWKTILFQEIYVKHKL
ncbi:putative disease resistance protein [Senna tora]|uniref:Putative disease resistance protein n=1 Tax=Senna tora TaxID=362788 RepID=A0A834XD78_9FABA|nr:putative disease resistance protein [Senna tora]